MRFQARIQGIDLDKELKQVDKFPTAPTKKSKAWFGDPAEYEHLSQKEREKLTKEMMRHHQLAARKLT